MPARKHIEKGFFRNWTSEMAYILGFFYADGTITVNSRGGTYFAFQIADRKLIDEFKVVMRANHKIGRRVYPGKRSVIYRLQIGSKEMCRDLRALGVVEQKTYRMTLPNIPAKYLRHFVRGYFDGDGNVWSGYIHKRRKKKLLAIQTAFTSCSKEFLDGLKDRLRKFHIEGSTYPCKDKKAFRLQYSIKSSILLYYLMYRQINSRLFLWRKKKVFEEYLRRKSAVVA